MTTSARRPTLPLTGGCPCGAVRYAITAMPLMLYTCNCTDCQRQSGSAFGMSMPTPSEAFRITQGVAKGWQRTSPSGASVTSWFCGDCGGRIYGERQGRPGSVNIRAGSLDDTSWLVPVAHFFTRSAQPWRPFAAQAECFETQPADFKRLADLWQQSFNEPETTQPSGSLDTANPDSHGNDLASNDGYQMVKPKSGIQASEPASSGQGSSRK